MFLSTAPKKTQGSSLVIALFIIVVLSLLGVALVKMIRTSAQSSVYEVVGTRAFQAAQTGMQIQLQDLFPKNGIGKSCVSTFTTRDLDAIEGFKGCKASYRCSETDDYYSLISEGVCELDAYPEKIQAVRRIEVQARDL